MIGGFTVFWAERGRPFPEGELRLMEGLASQAGIALENARLFRDNGRRVAELSVLHDLSRAVTGRLDRAGLVSTIQQQIARVFEIDHIILLLHDEVTDEIEVALRTAGGVADFALPRRYPRHGVGLMSVILDTSRAIRTRDYLAECRRHGVAAIEGPGPLPYWLGVPMRAGEHALGVLALRSRDREFTSGDEHLLGNIADLAALALRSAALYGERSRAYGELAAAQDQLVRTEKLRALGEMASGVAHDFNNVLAAIVGRAQLLLNEVRDPKLRRWIEVIERSGMDGAQTVRRLQEFTRIRRDQPVVAVSLNRVVQESLESTESRWRDEARTRGIVVEVATALAPDLPPVAGDPAELREALINLILNAVDAMPGGGRLSFATSADVQRVELLVADTGAGMPEHVRQRIFDPFFTTKGPQGTGLGLSMTYGILSRHGAQISVESEEGKGTRFRLTFPRTTLAEQSGSRARHALRDGVPALPRGGRRADGGRGAGRHHRVRRPHRGGAGQRSRRGRALPGRALRRRLHGPRHAGAVGLGGLARHLRAGLRVPDLRGDGLRGRGAARRARGPRRPAVLTKPLRPPGDAGALGHPPAEGVESGRGPPRHDEPHHHRGGPRPRRPPRPHPHRGGGGDGSDHVGRGHQRADRRLPHRAPHEGRDGGGADRLRPGDAPEGGQGARARGDVVGATGTDREMLIDTCGTGGDASGTFNVSTATAFVVAGAGLKVAKHGNRVGVARLCGSADVVETLGINLELTPAQVARCVDEVGIGFLYAPLLHTAMKHVMAARREMGVRTVFNMLGPLTNPAGANAQVIGVYAAPLTELLARVLAELGTLRAFVVHGADGLDEISNTGESQIAEVHEGVVRTLAGCGPRTSACRGRPSRDLQGGDRQENARHHPPRPRRASRAPAATSC